MATLVSSGVKNGEWDTRRGTFNVGVRVEAGTMNGAEGSPDFYSLDLVPYAQYFDGLISMHGTYWHNSFGYPHSHGCVNLSRERCQVAVRLSGRRLGPCTSILVRRDARRAGKVYQNRVVWPGFYVL